MGRYIYGGPGMSHKYEDDLFYRIDGITYYVIVKEEHNMFSEKSLYHEEIREHEYPMEPTLEELEGWCKKNNLTLKKNSEDYYKEVKKEEDEKAHPKTYRTCSGEVRRYR